MLLAGSFELEKARPKKVAASRGVRSGIMVKCRGNLNQSLKEHLLGIWRLEPHLFPMFVRLVKMPGIKGFQSFLKQPISFLGSM